MVALLLHCAIVCNVHSCGDSSTCTLICGVYNKLSQQILNCNVPRVLHFSASFSIGMPCVCQPYTGVSHTLGFGYSCKLRNYHLATIRKAVNVIFYKCVSICV